MRNGDMAHAHPPHQRRQCGADYRYELGAYEHHCPAQVGLDAPELVIVLVLDKLLQAHQLVPDGAQVGRDP